MPSVKQASAFPVSATRLRNRWLDSDQLFAFTASILRLAFDSTIELIPNPFSLLQLLIKIQQKQKIDQIHRIINSKNHKIDQKVKIKSQKQLHIRHHSTEEIGRASSGGAEFAEKRENEIIRQRIKKITPSGEISVQFDLPFLQQPTALIVIRGLRITQTSSRSHSTNSRATELEFSSV